MQDGISVLALRGDDLSGNDSLGFLLLQQT